MRKYPWRFEVHIEGINVETGKKETFKMIWIEHHYISDPRGNQK